MELVLPAENRRDFDEMPDYLKEDMVVHFAARYQDVADAVF
jgi:ATP-dependent Lon protease